MILVQLVIIRKLSWYYEFLTARFHVSLNYKPHDYVPRALQCEAIQWLDRHVLEAPLWLYPDDVVSKLGVDAVGEIQNRQQTLIAMFLSAGIIYSMYENAMRASAPYTVPEYLDDVFLAVWKPLDNADERLNDFRRQMERNYVFFLGRTLNPSDQDKNSVSVTAQRSDAILYAEQHLDRVEEYLKAQTVGGINGQHYKNLLLQIKKIREKYESGK